jgi:hypothetical protein
VPRSRGSTSILALLACGWPLAAQADWALARNPAPPAIDAAAHDVARGRLVVFATHGRGAREPATWEWDGTAWLEFRPVVSPPLRSHHALAYDAARRRTVLFGGLGASASLADTWEWDGAIWLHRQPRTTPPARGLHAMSFDLARQRVVMFGGMGTTQYLDDTWEWDGTDWVQRRPASVPFGRIGHRMAYDVARGRTVMYGGEGTAPSARTWEWDGVDWSAPLVTSPALRHAGLAYDAARARTVLCGAPDGTSPLQTWEWDGRTWVQHGPATIPAGGPDVVLAFDVHGQRTVLLAATANGLGSWEWNGRDWSARHLAAQPAPRVGAALACDIGRGRVVMFGGAARGGNACLDDTWEWDGARWHLRAPATRPPARHGHALAHDFARGRTVLFGGSATPSVVTPLADTWEWDGSAWSRIQAAASPPARLGHGMAHDLQRGRTLLFGGGDAARGFADTWEWDGSSWRQHVTPVAPTGGNRPLAYDAANRQVLLFAVGAAQHTWLWNGSTWSPQQPQNVPPVSSAVLACDLTRRRVVLTGLGITAEPTWEWDGSDWRPAPTGTRPWLPTAGWATAYDAAQQRVLLQFAEGGTWLFGVPTPARTVAFGAGCAGSSGVPVLVGTEPYLGSDACALDLLAARSGAPCLIGLAAATQALALGGGCTLHLAAPAVAHATLTDPFGFASVRCRVPFDPTLRGTVLYAQAVVADPLGAASGLAVTGGVRLTIGN